jgi:DNA-binding NtrC family response regulator
VNAKRGGGRRQYLDASSVGMHQSETLPFPLGAPEEMIAGSVAMRDLLALVKKVGPTTATVLIGGETGTGKELIARALHACSRVAAGPLEFVNCAAVPEALWESEFFGHERGAFTGAEKRRKGHFERAHGGTFVLDEIGEMPLAGQAKLLRVLEDGGLARVGGSRILFPQVRVIAATRRSLDADVAAGTFRADLFYRLVEVRIHIVPLRARPDDVPLLVAHFLRLHTGGLSGDAPEIASAAVQLLGEQPWPGNVRQLSHCIRGMLVVAPGRALGVDDVRRALAGQCDAEQFDVLAATPSAAALPHASIVAALPQVPVVTDELLPYIKRQLETPGATLHGCIGSVEALYLKEALLATGHNQTLAAELLGITRPTLCAKLAKHDLLDAKESRHPRKPR